MRIKIEGLTVTKRTQPKPQIFRETVPVRNGRERFRGGRQPD
ncbi:MAG: hypothetical protein SPL10_03500 [Synergistales bacterium]|nr:hypothetical protein [Synergistales bacterium]MDY6426322.1 hypothetical protein [Synergistales bacterium]MDY6429531.1 hypothetical protein [Synergistales bacterium]MDY6434169.1 hypothetical protein [Synergistales bacterium]